MPASPQIAALLERMVDEDAEFFAALEAIYAQRYTGPVILDFRYGLPKGMHYALVNVRLTNTQTEGLDKT